MARHRIGNSYLSDKELEEHKNSLWGVWLFVIGALFGGITAHRVMASFGSPKWAIFIGVVLGALALGSALTALRAYIRMAASLGIALLFLYIVGWCVWKVI